MIDNWDLYKNTLGGFLFMMKKYFIFFACIMVFGLMLGMMKSALNTPDELFGTVYCIVSGTILVGCIVFNMCYHRHYRKKMLYAMKLLEERKTDEYLVFVNELLSKVKGRYLKTLFTVNLSAGYTDIKEYQKAIALLESVSKNRMDFTLKMVHRLNLCCNYYYNNQKEQAMSTYEESLKIFKPFHETPMYGGNLAVLDIFMELCKENYEVAEALLVLAKAKWENPRLQEDYLHIEEVLKVSVDKNRTIYNEKIT